MQIDQATIDCLSDLELELYTGNSFDGIKKEREIRNKLHRLPVRIKVNLGESFCDDLLYRICKGLASREFTTIQELKGRLGSLSMSVIPQLDTSNWVQKIAPTLFTTLFNGVYVGEPEDVYNHRKGNKSKIWHPVKGLGLKIAEIEFLSYEEN